MVLEGKLMGKMRGDGQGKVGWIKALNETELDTGSRRLTKQLKSGKEGNNYC